MASDCLIKTKHCDHLEGFMYNAISAQCPGWTHARAHVLVYMVGRCV